MNNFKSLKKLKLDMKKINSILLVTILIIFIVCCFYKKTQIKKNEQLNNELTQLDFANNLINLSENFQNFK